MTEEKKSINQTIAFLAVIAFFVILALLIFYLSKTSEDPIPLVGPVELDDYNGVRSVKIEGTWFTTVTRNGVNYSSATRHSPREADVINSTGSASLNSSEIIITHDPVSDISSEQAYVTLAASELSNNLISGLGFSIEAGCTRDHPLCEGRPIVSCENESLSVIYLQRNETPGLEFNNSCIIIKGEGEDLLVASDKLIFIFNGMI